VLRFLVSLLAGGLVIGGAWYGWTRSTDIDAAMESAADRAGAPTPTSQRTPPSPTPNATALSTRGTEPGRPCDLPSPTDAAGMNTLMTQLDGEPRLQGADHGGSVMLADGRRLFVYGDTVRDTDVVGAFMVRNSVLVANGGCLKAMRVEGDGAVIPDTGDLGHWPMSLRADPVPGGTRVQVLTATVHELGGRDFETIGTGLATFEVPTNRMPRLVSHRAVTARSTDPRVPTWGAAMWDEGPWTYVFGTASDEGKTTAGWSLHVARTPTGSLASARTWEYWDGSSWVAGDPAAAQTPAAQLVGADQGVSHVLGVFERDGSWFAVSKEGDFQGDQLAVWKAPSVTGPWTKHRVRPLGNDASTVRYTVLSHPDLTTPPGTVLVSWSEAPTSEPDFHTHPQRYRPRFAEIELP
jgi:hypothetical protein